MSERTDGSRKGPWDDDELLSLVARLLGQPDIYGQPGGIPVWELEDPAIESPDR